MSPATRRATVTTSTEALSEELGVASLEEVVWVARMVGPDEGEASLVHIRVRPRQPPPTPGRPETSRRVAMPPRPATICGKAVPEGKVFAPRPEDARCASCHRLSQQYGPAVLERK